MLATGADGWVHVAIANVNARATVDRWEGSGSHETYTIHGIVDGDLTRKANDAWYRTQFKYTCERVHMKRLRVQMKRCCSTLCFIRTEV